MAASTISGYEAMLKERYADSDRVEKLVFGENFFLETLKKRGPKDLIGGRYIRVPIQYGLPGGLGTNFANLQAQSDNSKQLAVNVETGDWLGRVSFGQKTILASQQNSQAFFKNEILETDGLYERAGDLLATYAVGNGGNSIGRVGSVNGNVITLQTLGDVANFEVGQFIQGSNDGDGGAGTETLLPGYTYITAISRRDGTITVNNAADIVGLAANTYLANKDDFYGASGNPLIMRGLSAWITSSESPAALYNLTAGQRAIDPQRFAGCRMPDSEISGLTLDERLTKAGAYLTSVFKAAAPSTVWCNPLDWDVLSNQLRTRGYRIDTDSSTKFGHSSITATIAGKSVPIRADRHFQRGTIWLLREEDFGLHWLGNELLFPQDEGVGQWLRMYNSTDIEFRLLCYPAFTCWAPRNQMRFSTTG